MVLDDFQTPRVQAHAGAALVNFCEQCPKSILLDYLEVIVAKLENVFRVKLEEVSWNGPTPRRDKDGDGGGGGGTRDGDEGGVRVRLVSKDPCTCALLDELCALFSQC